MLSRVGGQTENSIKSAATESLNWNSFNWKLQRVRKNVHGLDQERKWEEKWKKKKECPEVSSWLENFSAGVCQSLENQNPLW